MELRREYGDAQGDVAWSLDLVMQSMHSGSIDVLVSGKE